MQSAPHPENETLRIAELIQYQVLDTPAEPGFDEITQLAASICQTPMAAISLIDQHRQWFKSRVALSATETSRDVALCAHAILNPQAALIVEDTLTDNRFFDNPLVVDYPNIRFYAGWPLQTKSGEALGTLCVVDTQPRQLSAVQQQTLRILANQVMQQLELRKELLQCQQLMQQQQETEQRLKALNQQWQLKEERLQLALNGCRDGLWDWNVITGEVYYSPSFMALCGYQATELPHTIATWNQLLHPQDLPIVYASVSQHFKERGSCNVEYRMRHKDGNYIWFHARGQASWDDTGQPVRMTGFTMNIQERKTADDSLQAYVTQIANTNDQLATASAKAKESSRLKSEFLANMSHEIRTPMNGIIGMTQLLLDSPLGDTERHYIETIARSSDALLQIINDILDFSKIEAGKITLESIPFDFQFLCEEICEIMAVNIGQKKQLECLLRYAPNTQRYLIGDPGRIRQIIFNLLSNAIKFTETGHVLLSVQQIGKQSDPCQFHIRVEDTGIGIPQDKLEYIFNKFNQSDSSIARKFGGTGLGLAICNELIRLMGGEKMRVESEVGHGSTFSFDCTIQADTATNKRFIIPPQKTLKGLRVLVIDDNPIAREIIREQLQSYGIELMERDQPQDAAILLGSEQKFDLIILNSMLSKINDAEKLAQYVKAKVSTRDIPLLMITSTPCRNDKQLSEKLGFSGYLSKPLIDWQLRDAISVICNAKKNGAPIPLITQHNLKEARALSLEKRHQALLFMDAHILLVEDNPVNQMVAMHMLEKYGCSVKPALDGKAAVELVQQQRFDLILMDCQMPILDGYEATQMIRQLPSEQGHHTPIVAFTAHALKGDDQKCFAAGMDGYLTKPIRQYELEQALLQWLTPSQPEQAKQVLRA